MESAEGTPNTLDAVAMAEQLAKLQAEKAELLQTLIRRQADFENYRKRLERERHEASDRGVARLIEQMLPILDAFERALAAHDDPAYEEYRKGFELIHRQLWDALSREGLERIEAEGKKFDPHVHHAIEGVESQEHEDGTVVAVLLPGYVLRGKILRPATVRVVVQPAQKAAEE
jgi:molecular chaperone GrpE